MPALRDQYTIFESMASRAGLHAAVVFGADVLNTNINVRVESIVKRPVDAGQCFFSTGLDYLVFGDYLTYKGAAPDDA